MGWCSISMRSISMTESIAVLFSNSRQGGREKVRANVSFCHGAADSPRCRCSFSCLSVSSRLDPLLRCRILRIDPPSIRRLPLVSVFSSPANNFQHPNRRGGDLQGDAGSFRFASHLTPAKSFTAVVDGAGRNEFRRRRMARHTGVTIRELFHQNNI